MSRNDEAGSAAARQAEHDARRPRRPRCDERPRRDCSPKPCALPGRRDKAVLPRWALAARAGRAGDRCGADAGSRAAEAEGPRRGCGRKNLDRRVLRHARVRGRPLHDRGGSAGRRSRGQRQRGRCASRLRGWLRPRDRVDHDRRILVERADLPDHEQPGAGTEVEVLGMDARTGRLLDATTATVAAPIVVEDELG